MNCAVAAKSMQAFFLQARQGQRFCLFHPPGQHARGALLYVHPFAEEMNKTRRMAALQARSFARQGYGVLQIDLYGCGDSSGDFADARWDIWKQDLTLALDWLAARHYGPIGIWGLRLGALLALDFSVDGDRFLERLILWQPVLSGKIHLNQFLRLRVASQMLGMDDAPSVSNASLRMQLAGGSSVEVAGYELSAELASAIDGKDGTMLTPRCPTYWFESTTINSAESIDGIKNEVKSGRKNDETARMKHGEGDTPALSPVVARSAARWRTAGVALHLHPLCGAPFWATTEMTECQAMLAATDAICT
jgi:exosortase A-associated hydrolase 2